MDLKNQINDEARKLVTRRWFFKECGVGLGSIALASLLRGTSASAAQPSNPLTPRFPHFAPKAKRVIYMFQAGAPSHLDLYDGKQKLAEMQGEELPPSVRMGQRITG